MIRARVSRTAPGLWLWDVYEVDPSVTEYDTRDMIVCGANMTWRAALDAACAWIRRESGLRG